MDTSFSYTDRNEGAFSSDERCWINKIRKLKEEYPDKVIIEREPEKNNGCICAKLPPSWMKFAPPRKLKLTEEQKQVLSERMRKLHSKQSKSL